MEQQPETPSSTLTVSPAPVPGTHTDPIADAHLQSAIADPQPQHHGAPRWLVRVELSLRVILRMYIGLAVCYMPWSGQVFTSFPWSHSLWDHNPLWDSIPALASFATSGAVRGIVSGIGLLNVWIAFHDAIRHRD